MFADYSQTAGNPLADLYAQQLRRRQLALSGAHGPALTASATPAPVTGAPAPQVASPLIHPQPAPAPMAKPLPQTFGQFPPHPQPQAYPQPTPMGHGPGALPQLGNRPNPFYRRARPKPRIFGGLGAPAAGSLY